MTSPGDQAGTSWLSSIGPGLVAAACGVGAGDVTATSLAAVRLGGWTVLVVLIAAVVKAILHEAMARHQLLTGETLPESWAGRLSPWLKYLFAAYLIVWTPLVFAAVAAVCGVTLDLLVPLGELDARLAAPVYPGGPETASVVWAILATLLGATLLIVGGYDVFERLMSSLALAMTALVLVAASTTFFDSTASESVVAAPAPLDWGLAELSLVVAVVGGLGGTVTILSYGYYLREHGRVGADKLSATRLDVAASYVVAGLFAVSIALLVGNLSGEDWRAVGVDPKADKPSLRSLFAAVEHYFARRFDAPWGAVGGKAFLTALAATVFSSLLGILQGVPYLWVDFAVLVAGGDREARAKAARQGSPWFRATVVLLALVTAATLFWDRPQAVFLVYALVGAGFSPFLAATLFVLLSRRDGDGPPLGSRLDRATLATAFLLFAAALVLVVAGKLGWIS